MVLVFQKSSPLSLFLLYIFLSFSGNIENMESNGSLFRRLKGNEVQTMGKEARPAYRKPRGEDENRLLSGNLEADLIEIRRQLANSDDLLIHRHRAGRVELAVMMFDGLVSNTQVSDFLLRPVTRIPPEMDTGEKVYRYLGGGGVIMAGEQKEVRTFGELMAITMSGFAVVLVEGVPAGLALGYQGFKTRGVDEPSSERNLRGSREGFTESINSNMGMVRRRMRSPLLTIEGTTAGTVSNTVVKIFYLRGMASPRLVQEIKERISKVEISVVLDSGYLQPFLDGKRLSLFSGVGMTERPDTLCAKLSEGRVAVMVEGTPFALILPYLFIEHFQSLDDYIHRPYFASFIRLLKLLSFFVTILLPGYYVAVVSFHPELIPQGLLSQFVGSALDTPLPVVLEALVVFFLYELLREAGLRIPSPIGHAMGIVGGIVIGDAAVSAGLIGLPMVIIIALTAVSSFVVPSLYEPVTVLRFAFIVVGGLLGLYGVYLSFALLVFNLCSIKSMGVPVTAPISPADGYSFRDMFIRSGWKVLQKETLRVENLPGAEGKERD